MSRLLDERKAIQRRLLEVDPECRQLLYHGTSYPEKLSVIDPQPSRTMIDKIKGHFVFAARSFTMAVVHANKVLVNRDYVDHVGVSVFRSFTGGAGTPYDGMTTEYCIVPHLEWFNSISQGGYVYGIKPDGFKERGAGEYTSQESVCPEFGLRVEGLIDLMEINVQVFALSNEYDADDFSYNWQQLEHDDERACALDQFSKQGYFRWLNKEQGFEIPMGPMHHW
ncbi:MAG: hypothetical protein AB8B83_01055 [Bdellovibrionales bacterium]